MLFQCLCGFKPVFYSTHSDDEPLKYAFFQKSITRLFRSGQHLLFKVHPTMDLVGRLKIPRAYYLSQIQNNSIKKMLPLNIAPSLIYYFNQKCLRTTFVLSTIQL